MTQPPLHHRGLYFSQAQFLNDNLPYALLHESGELHLAYTSVERAAWKSRTRTDKAEIAPYIPHWEPNRWPSWVNVCLSRSSDRPLSTIFNSRALKTACFNHAPAMVANDAGIILSGAQ